MGRAAKFKKGQLKRRERSQVERTTLSPSKKYVCQCSGCHTDFVSSPVWREGKMKFVCPNPSCPGGYSIMAVELGESEDLDREF